MAENIALEIVTPERHVLSENVQSVEMPGKDGYLGVLPGHAPLLTELGLGVLAYRLSAGTGGGAETRYLSVIHGYGEVLPGRVIVLAELAERAEEIDLARTQAARERAQAELSRATPGDEDWRRASFALQRALVRQQAAARAGASGSSADGASASASLGGPAA